MVKKLLDWTASTFWTIILFTMSHWLCENVSIKSILIVCSIFVGMTLIGFVITSLPDPKKIADKVIKEIEESNLDEEEKEKKIQEVKDAISPIAKRYENKRN